jgi:hypothetical protein
MIHDRERLLNDHWHYNFFFRFLHHNNRSFNAFVKINYGRDWICGTSRLKKINRFLPRMALILATIQREIWVCTKSILIT